MPPEPTTEPARRQPPFRLMLPTYIAAPFGNGLFDAVLIIVPLFALHLGASPSEIGLVVGARYFMPLLLAIHGGALVDRLGAKRMTFLFGTVTLAAVPLYPLMTWFPALLALQLLVGLTTSLGWIGIQTTVIHQTHADPTYLGRFTFCQQIGATAAPILAGAMWDLTGVWGAFLFIAGWTACFLTAVSFIRDAKPPPEGSRPQWRDLIPKPADYWSTFLLMATPAVGLAIAVTIVRHTTTPIQSSFYLVYLEQLGMTGTAIGVLIALVEIMNGIGPLASGYLARRFPMHWLLIVFSAAAIFLISITPLLGGIVVLLGAIQILRGTVQGLIQPMFLSVIAQAVPPDVQGRSIGLRTMANRVGSFTVPVIMGYVVEAVGIEKGFYYTGGVLIAILAAIGIVVWRSKALDTPADAPRP